MNVILQCVDAYTCIVHKKTVFFFGIPRQNRLSRNHTPGPPVRECSLLRSGQRCTGSTDRFRLPAGPALAHCWHRKIGSAFKRGCGNRSALKRCE